MSLWDTMHACIVCPCRVLCVMHVCVWQHPPLADAFVRALGRPASKYEVANTCTEKLTGNQPVFVLSNEHIILLVGGMVMRTLGCLRYLYSCYRNKSLTEALHHMWQSQAWSTMLSVFFSNLTEELKEGILNCCGNNSVSLTQSLLCCLFVHLKGLHINMKIMDAGSSGRETSTVSCLMWQRAVPFLSC